MVTILSMVAIAMELQRTIANKQSWAQLPLSVDKSVVR
jgi:hypothetical protein